MLKCLAIAYLPKKQWDPNTNHLKTGVILKPVFEWSVYSPKTFETHIKTFGFQMIIQNGVQKVPTIQKWD